MTAKLRPLHFLADVGFESSGSEEQIASREVNAQDRRLFGRIGPEFIHLAIHPTNKLNCAITVHLVMVRPHLRWAIFGLSKWPV